MSLAKMLVTKEEAIMPEPIPCQVPDEEVAPEIVDETLQPKSSEHFVESYAGIEDIFSLEVDQEKARKDCSDNGKTLDDRWSGIYFRFKAEPRNGALIPAGNIVYRTDGNYYKLKQDLAVDVMSVDYDLARSKPLPDYQQIYFAPRFVIKDDEAIKAWEEYRNEGLAEQFKTSLDIAGIELPDKK